MKIEVEERKKRILEKNYPACYIMSLPFYKLEQHKERILNELNEGLLEVLGFDDDITAGLIENHIFIDDYEHDEELLPEMLHDILLPFLGERDTNYFMNKFWQKLIDITVQEDDYITSKKQGTDATNNHLDADDNERKNSEGKSADLKEREAELRMKLKRQKTK